MATSDHKESAGPADTIIFVKHLGITDHSVQYYEIKSIVEMFYVKVRNIFAHLNKTVTKNKIRQCTGRIGKPVLGRFPFLWLCTHWMQWNPWIVHTMVIQLVLQVKIGINPALPWAFICFISKSNQLHWFKTNNFRHWDGPAPERDLDAGLPLKKINLPKWSSSSPRSFSDPSIIFMTAWLHYGVFRILKALGHFRLVGL